MQVGIGRRVETKRPFKKLYIDFLGKYPKSKSGHAWIIIVVDHFSKYTFLRAIRRLFVPKGTQHDHTQQIKQ